MADDLAQLEAQAASVDAEATAAEAGPPPEAEAIPVDVAAEVAALLQTVAGILTPAFPSLGEIYTEATCRRLGDAAAPVMQKYGVSVGGIFDKWGPEITLAAVALPIAFATVRGIRADLDKRRHEEKEIPPERYQGDTKPEPASAEADTKKPWSQDLPPLV